MVEIAEIECSDASTNKDLHKLNGLLAKSGQVLYVKEYGYDLAPNRYWFSATSARREVTIRRGPVPKGLRGLLHVIRQDFNQEPRSPVVANVGYFKNKEGDKWIVNCTELATQGEVTKLVKSVAALNEKDAVQRVFWVRSTEFGVGTGNPLIERWVENP